MDPRPRARVLRRSRAGVLGGAARRTAGARAHRLPPSGRVVRGGDDPELDPRDDVRFRFRTRLCRVPVADRPAACRRSDVGTGIAHVLRRGDVDVLSLARARRYRSANRSRAPTRGALMDLMASFLEGAILSWALPLSLLIIVTIWWVGSVWSRGDDDS